MARREGTPLVFAKASRSETHRHAPPAPDRMGAGDKYSQRSSISVRGSIPPRYFFPILLPPTAALPLYVGQLRHFANFHRARVALAGCFPPRYRLLFLNLLELLQRRYFEVLRVCGLFRPDIRCASFLWSWSWFSRSHLFPGLVPAESGFRVFGLPFLVALVFLFLFALPFLRSGRVLSGITPWGVIPTLRRRKCQTP